MTLEYINSLSNVLDDPILISFFVTYIVITFFGSASLKPPGQVASYFFICSFPIVNEFSTLTESGEMDFGCSAVLRESMHVSSEVLIRDLSMTSAFRQAGITSVCVVTCNVVYVSPMGTGRSSEVERSLMVRWVVGSILHGVDPLSYFSFQPVLHDWYNKGRGMCYPVCGMVHIKEPLLLIGKSSPCGGSGFPLSLSEWSLTICLTPNNRR